ncbi:MAG TPA: helix-turn-helix domain-containing protein [Burkholderiaceae bacterium]
MRRKLTSAYEWRFCELCGETTEFAVAISEKVRGFYKRNGTEVPLSAEICAKAEKISDTRARSYERALNGYGRRPHIANRLILKYCGIDGFRKLNSEALRDRSQHEELGCITVEQFRLYVEGRTRMALWASQGQFIGAVPNRKHVKSDQDGNLKLSRAGEPSKFYCERHNQYRNDAARRNYQRDRLLSKKFRELIAQIWSEQISTLPTWDIEAHAHVRREAYRILQESKPLHVKLSDGMIDELRVQGITNQSEIARRLGVSRQAVSAAIKRKAN